MASFRPDYLLRLRFGAAEIGAIRRLGEARGRQELLARRQPGPLDALRARALLESTGSSNRIDGVVAPNDRLQDLVVKRAEPRGRFEQEVAGYRDALQLIHQTHASIPFTVNVVLQLHQMLYRYEPGTGGRWKAADLQIVERDDTGRPLHVRFDPTPAALTPAAMAALTDGYREASNAAIADPLVLVPLAILDFLCVHPFSQGNGRVARLLTLLLLYKVGYQIGRYVSLERIVEESRDAYDAALERSSQGWHHNAHDAMPWLSYFWDVLIRAHDEFESRGASRLRSKTDQVRAAVLARSGAFGMLAIVDDCPGVSRDMVRHVLRQMRADGLVGVEGRGRAARWQNTGAART